MLAAQLGPFRKLVLAAGRVQLSSDGEILFLLLAVLDVVSGDRAGGREDDAPDLLPC